MLQTASFFSDAEINAVFAQTPAENSNIEHIGNIIQQIQLHMDTVLDMMTNRQTGDQFVLLLIPMSFLYAGVLSQTNDLFNRIEQKYDGAPSTKWLHLLKKCGHLRSTIRSIYDLLQQTKARQTTHYPQLNDEHINAAMAAYE